VIDRIAAFATGFAGSYGLAREDISDEIPGGAIAISLVPSLAVVRMAGSAGDWGSTWGAFLLFASNVVAIIVAGTIVFTLHGYRRGVTGEAWLPQALPYTLSPIAEYFGDGLTP
jgi:uncharacterized membrane protein